MQNTARVSSEALIGRSMKTAGSVAAPESANNAGAQTSFIPMLTLGIPSNVIMALMIGAMMIQGMQPGPGIPASSPTSRSYSGAWSCRCRSAI
jgi:TctA family transporter